MPEAVNIKELLKLSDTELLAREDVRRAYHGEGPWKHDFWHNPVKKIYDCFRCEKPHDVMEPDGYCPIPPLITDPIEVVAEVLWRKAVNDYYTWLVKVCQNLYGDIIGGEKGVAGTHWWAYYATPRHRLISALMALEEER